MEMRGIVAAVVAAAVALVYVVVTGWDFTTSSSARPWRRRPDPGTPPSTARQSRTGSAGKNKQISQWRDRQVWLAEAALWNRNYFLRFRFRFWNVMVPVPTFKQLWFRFLLLKSYGSGSYFWKVTVPVFALLYNKLFYKQKVYKFQQIYCKMWNVNEGYQIHNFVSSSGSGTEINYGSDFLTSYGSGSTSQKVTVPTVPVPVPQRWAEEKQWQTERYGN